MSVIDTANKAAQGKKFTLRRGDFIFERILAKTDKFLVYDTQSKNKPLYTIPEEKFEDEWIHSTVVRLTKLKNDEAFVKGLFDQFETRKSINYETCPHLLTFHDQGLIQWGENVYYATRYDDPCRDFEYWVNVDHQGLEIEALDCFRLARGALEAFSYLEENGFVLTQFNEKNLYVGSFSEDRGNFFRIMFKGNKDKNTTVSFANKNKFSPPENDSKDIYKSYLFSVGLMILWAIYTTNNKGGEFPNDVHANTGKLGDLIKNAVDICYKEGKEKPEHKELFKVFMEDLLEVSVDKRRSAKELLTYKWIIESDKLDYEEYQREVEENERAKQKEKEEEEKNKFN
mmetsp:Transcript_318/g.298  ORF Transcript_318/g.298 Transcript_318/m.298 type:complete len:343 (-) Transcript_318:339-1367(-)|eukprot:CAMPEP_0114575612 /NCGR_PEP_ID=MMETSP0125-20121206/470_1 /TAXON_ID=485358 ORGANISM="Aristerostoma sp., Strain ATCC 50986" /NCGR_SAMPLE_ID=MMETSP0125 /ASSEMBLY_ACC=CAM_ASM_000245 /LENGTH=342 /DNA_ID=CAMNT_0001763493 /DNA_START=71 /DNA_END=1099 /DNA_ORIENTATION=-